jgi:hypothetical protein
MPKFKVFVDYGQGGIRKTTSIVLEAETGGDAEQIAANMYNPVNRVSHTLIPETNYSSDAKTNSSSSGKLAKNVKAQQSMSDINVDESMSITSAIKKLTTAIANDTQEFEQLLKAQSEQTKILFDTYVKSLKSENSDEILKAMEKLILSMDHDTSEKFEKFIDAQGQRKDLNQGPTIEREFAKFMGADSDKGFLDSIVQAFSEPGRMFGKSGLLGTGLFSGGSSKIQREVKVEIEKEKAIANLDKVTKKEYDNIIEQEDYKERKPINKPESFGSDDADSSTEQLNILKDILKELKIISEKLDGGENH